MNITNRYKVNKTTNHYVDMIYKPWTKESKNSFKYHLAVKTNDNVFCFYNIVPTFILTHKMLSYMMYSPVISISKKKINKNKVLKLFEDKPAYKKEIEAQLNDKTMSHLIFSVKNCTYVNFNGDDVRSVKINEDKCLKLNDSTDIVTEANNTVYTSNGEYKNLYEENECSYYSYIKNDLVKVTKKRVKAVKPNKVVEPVKVEVAQEPEKTIDKNSIRYQTLVQLFGNNEELIKKMY